jgi:F-type H+-transporting ATPase subunit delta
MNFNMKRNRRLDSLVKQALNSSIKNGKIADEKVTQFSKTFAQLHRPEAIYALSRFLKLLKMEEDKRTLTVQSSTPLSKTELNDIEKKFSNTYNLQTTNFQLLPSLLGGIMVKIGDMVFDHSVKGKIEQVKEAIIS